MNNVVMYFCPGSKHDPPFDESIGMAMSLAFGDGMPSESKFTRMPSEFYAWSGNTHWKCPQPLDEGQEDWEGNVDGYCGYAQSKAHKVRKVRSWLAGRELDFRAYSLVSAPTGPVPYSQELATSVFDISIRNHRADAGTGTPEPVGDGTYSAAQIRALFAAHLAVQLSDDGSVWYDADPEDGTPDTARWYRFRNAAVGLEWSDPLPLLVGPRGLRSTIEVGEVRSGNPGTQPVIENVGDEHDAVFDFTIPQGQRGAAATIRVGTTEMVGTDEEPEVTNSGTSSDAVFNFKIPRGQAEATAIVNRHHPSVAVVLDNTAPLLR